MDVLNQGTVVAFYTETDEERQWVDENVELEDWQRLGGMGFAVEHRCAGPLIEGLQAEGFTMNLL